MDEFAAVIGEVIKTWDSHWRFCMEVRQDLGKFREVFLSLKNNTKMLPISIRYRRRTCVIIKISS